MDYKKIALVVIVLVVILIAAFSLGLFGGEEEYSASGTVEPINASVSVADYTPSDIGTFYATSEDENYYYGNYGDGESFEMSYTVTVSVNLSDVNWTYKHWGNSAPNTYSYIPLDDDDEDARNYIDSYIDNNLHELLSNESNVNANMEYNVIYDESAMEDHRSEHGFQNLTLDGDILTYTQVVNCPGFYLSSDPINLTISLNPDVDNITSLGITTVIPSDKIDSYNPEPEMGKRGEAEVVKTY